MTGHSERSRSYETLGNLIAALEGAARELAITSVERRELAMRLQTFANELAELREVVVRSPFDQSLARIVFDDKPPTSGASKICEMCKRPLP